VTRLNRFLLVIAASTSLAAGLIHLVVIPEHWRESWLYGGFFVAATVVQVGLAVLLVRRPSAVLLIGNIAVQLGLVALWAFTRTAGIPLGPESGEVEAVGLLDSLCVAAQIVSAAACAVLLWYRAVPAGPATSRRDAATVGG
jgi:hypothetical protein